MIKAIVGSALILVSGFSQAGEITSASSVLTNTMGSYPNFGSVSKIIDQTGLSANYISGLTNFDTFISSGVTHAQHDNFGWLSAAGVYSGSLTFDLGSVLDVTKFVMWNGAEALTANVNGFSISTSSTSDFNSSVTVGNFNGQMANYGASVYDLTDTNARYVKLTINGNFGNGCCTAIGGIAFETSPVAAVPEPETYATLLAGLGLIGGALNRRKAKQA